MSDEKFDWKLADSEFSGLLKEMESLRKKRAYYVQQLESLDRHLSQVRTKILEAMDEHTSQ